jgi:HAMP domain-containing protein
MSYKMLNNLKLGTKLNLLLCLIFLLVATIGGWALSIILERQAQQVIADKATILIETMTSVREYTSAQINPELAPRLETEAKFLPQTVPAYSALEVFENLRKREEYNDFFYKEATLNPTNLRNKSDSFETSVVEQFRNQSGLKELSGFRSLPSGDVFYVARPLTISDPKCLRCHSTPDAAPKSQLATYGSENGFGWKLNEIVGAKVISVPASRVFNAAQRLQLSVIGILTGFFLIAILLINFFLKYAVTKPLKQMAQLSKKVSTGNMDGEFKHHANDEIGMLAASLNRMKVSLEMAMSMLDTDAKL